MRSSRRLWQHLQASACLAAVEGLAALSPATAPAQAIGAWDVLHCEYDEFNLSNAIAVGVAHHGRREAVHRASRTTSRVSSARPCGPSRTRSSDRAARGLPWRRTTSPRARARPRRITAARFASTAASHAITAAGDARPSPGRLATAARSAAAPWPADFVAVPLGVGVSRRRRRLDGRGRRGPRRRGRAGGGRGGSTATPRR